MAIRKQTIESYKEYLRSDAWNERRIDYLLGLALKKGVKCEKCGKRGIIQVHHRSYDYWPGLEPDTELIALCPSCHMEAHADSQTQFPQETRGWVTP